MVAERTRVRWIAGNLQASSRTRAMAVLTPEMRFAVGSPNVLGGADCLFGTIIEVVAEGRANLNLNSIAATNTSPSTTIKSHFFSGRKYPGNSRLVDA